MASSLSVNRGETLAVVGESGCGKTVTARSVLKLIDMPPGRFEAGEILLARPRHHPAVRRGEWTRSAPARSPWCSRSR